MNKPIVYVFCKDWSEFQQFQKAHPEVAAEYIVDENTLRGRTPGKIMRHGAYNERFDFIAIEESIAIHEELWKDSLLNKELKDSSTDDEPIEKEKGDDIYGV